MPSAKTVAGRYEIMEVLSRRGPRVTYKVQDAFLNRQAALVTFAEPVNDTSVRDLVSECATLTSVNHPTIAEVLHRGYLDDASQIPFYVVTYAAGGLRLDELIQAESRLLTPARVASFMSLVCRGVQAARDAGISATRVEPADLIVFKDGAARIQRLGPAENGGAAADDVHHLASICYSALSFQSPPLESTAPPLRSVNPDVPEKLAAVIDRALDPDPAKRYASPVEFAEALLSAAPASGSDPRPHSAPAGFAHPVLIGDPLPNAADRPPAQGTRAGGPGEFTRMFGIPHQSGAAADASAPPEAAPKVEPVRTDDPKPPESSKGVGDFTKAFKLPASFTDRPLPDHIAPDMTGEPVRVKSTSPPPEHIRPSSEFKSSPADEFDRSFPNPKYGAAAPKPPEGDASGIFEPRLAPARRQDMPDAAPFADRPFPSKPADADPAAPGEPSKYSKYIKIPDLDTGRYGGGDPGRTKIFDASDARQAGGGSAPDSSAFDRIANRSKPADPIPPARPAQSAAPDRKLILIAGIAAIVIIAIVIGVFVGTSR